MFNVDLRAQQRYALLTADAETDPFDRRKISPYNFVASTVFLDAALIAVLGVVLNWAVSILRANPAELQEWQAWAIFLAILLQFITAKAFGAYRVENAFCLSASMKSALFAHFVTFATIAIFAVAAKQAQQYSRLWFFSWALASTASACALRLFLTRRAFGKVAAGHHVSRALSVGVGGPPIGPHEIESKTQMKTRVIFAQRLQSAPELATLAQSIAAHQIDCLFVSARWEEIPIVASTLSALSHLSVKIVVLPQEEALLGIVDASLFGGDRLALCVSQASIEGWRLWAKRVEDLVVAGAALVLLAPLFGLVALAIKLDSPGPVFFHQIRVGFNGRRFELWKFRSMYVEATDRHAETQTGRGDKRVTRVGRLIRRLSIDELPQLLNVLDGTMSIVGPRPHALATKADNLPLEEAFDDYAARHRVKPGLTGLAQVNGLRGELTSVAKLRRRIDFDLQYIERWSVWLDLWIIAKTAGIVLWDCSAY